MSKWEYLAKGNKFKETQLVSVVRQLSERELGKYLEQFKVKHKYLSNKALVWTDYRYLLIEPMEDI